MVDIYENERDDDEFLTTVDAIVKGAAVTYKPLEVYLVSVSGWFDHKWLKFSGTVMHEIGVQMRNTTLPPFHPHRIESQKYYRWSEAEQTHKQEQTPTQLHIYQRSARNLKRKISSVSDSAMFVWYTCDTKQNGKGSLMVYIHTESHQAAWFIGFDQKNHWQNRQLKAISVVEMQHLEKVGRQVAEAEEEKVET